MNCEASDAAAVAEDAPLPRGERLARGEGEDRVEPAAAEEALALLLRAGAAELAAGLTEGDAVAQAAAEADGGVLSDGTKLLVDTSDTAAVGEAGPVPMREPMLVGVEAEEMPAL